MISRVSWMAVLVGSGVLSWAAWMGPVHAADAVAADAVALEGPLGTSPSGNGAIANRPPTTSANLLHVNGSAGDDVQGDGSQLRPLRTITHALRIAQPNTIILLAPGIYSADSGEAFPIQLRPGVTIQGSPGPNRSEVVIQGSAAYLSRRQGLRHIAVLGADRAGLANVTVSNPHPEGYGLWVESGSPIIQNNAFVGNGAVGVYLTGSGAPVIRGNYFTENGQTGLVIAGNTAAQVQGNVFENTGRGISVAPGATPQILDNRIMHNQEGLVLHAEAQPVLENNQIQQNRRNQLLDYTPWPQGDAPPAAADRATVPPPPRAAGGPEASRDRPSAPPVTPSTSAPSPAAAIAPPSEPPSEPRQAEETRVTPPTTETAAPPGAVEQNSDADREAETAAQRDRIGQQQTDLAATETAPEATPSAIEIPVTPPTAALSVGLSPSEITALRDRIRQRQATLAAAAAEATAPPAPDEDTDLAALRDRIRQRRAELAAADATNGDANSDAEATLDAIDIPVNPPPADPAELTPAEILALRDRLRQQQADSADERAASGAAGPITPPPTAAIATPDASPSVGSDLPPIPATALSEDILVVPSPDIPVGEDAALPEVRLPDLATTSGTEAAPPPPPSRATALGLNYRVLVTAADETTQAALRAAVPDAFRVRVNGQVMMQAGAYETQEAAQERAEALRQQGFQVQVEYTP